MKIENLGFLVIALIIFGSLVGSQVEPMNRRQCSNPACDCDEISSGCGCDDPCECATITPAPPEPQPEPEPDPFPRPEPIPDVTPDEVDPPKPAPKPPKIESPLCQCNAGGTPCECIKCECGLAPLKKSEAGIPASGYSKEIILHSRDNCPPCDSWWFNERPKFEAAGWRVCLHVLSNNEPGLSPFFTVEVDGKTFQLKGYQTIESVSKVIQ